MKMEWRTGEYHVSNLPRRPGQHRETGANTGCPHRIAWSGEEMDSASGGARGLSACWWGNGPPRRRSVAGLRGRSATLGLRHGPDSYGRQQWGILRNGRKPDAATPREGRRPSGCKPLSGGTKPLGLIAQRVTVPPEEAPANYVPAAAVIRRGQALSGFIGRKERVGGLVGPL